MDCTSYLSISLTVFPTVSCFSYHLQPFSSSIRYAISIFRSMPSSSGPFPTRAWSDSKMGVILWLHELHWWALRGPWNVIFLSYLLQLWRVSFYRFSSTYWCYQEVTELPDHVRCGLSVFSMCRFVCKPFSQITSPPTSEVSTYSPPKSEMFTSSPPKSEITTAVPPTSEAAVSSATAIFNSEKVIIFYQFSVVYCDF